MTLIIGSVQVDSTFDVCMKITCKLGQANARTQDVKSAPNLMRKSFAIVHLLALVKVLGLV